MPGIDLKARGSAALARSIHDRTNPTNPTTLMKGTVMKSIGTGLLSAALIATCTWPGQALAHGDAQRSVVFTMTDNMRFTPDTLKVRVGETLRIVVRNEGKMLHEFVLGTKKELDEHAALMVKFPTMEHDEPYMAHVPAGKSGEIVWTFNRAGDFDFACLIAGHYQAGMVGKITVAAK
jgi:uncharacterized cupredoxin-like copper-binding protein